MGQRGCEIRSGYQTQWLNLDRVEFGRSGIAFKSDAGKRRKVMNKKYFAVIFMFLILVLGLSSQFLFPGKSQPKADSELEQLNFKMKEIAVNGKKFSPNESEYMPLNRAQELSISLVVQSLDEKQPLKNAIASLSQNLKIGRAIIAEAGSKNAKIKGHESTISFQMMVPKDAEIGKVLLSVSCQNTNGKRVSLANIPCSIVADK